MNDTLIHEIVVRFQGGASIRRIAQSLHISRRTVKRVLDRIERARGADSVTEPSQPGPRRDSQLDALPERDHRSSGPLSRHHDAANPRRVAAARLPGKLLVALQAGA